MPLPAGNLPNCVKEILVALVLWLTLLSDSDEKVGKHSTTSRLCSFKPCKVGVTKSQATVYHEYCDGTFSICGGFFFRYTPVSGFGGLGVGCWRLVPKFAGSNPAEAVGFLRARRGSKAVGPMS